MECNKDEALRAKSIAEDKFTRNDFLGSKKFALKAQALYPGLDGISQMLATLDVYVSAENKVSGEMDWYGVLGVSPSADEETMKKQYRKLALLLHPDKNRSVGAEGAFRLISDAWNLLSDKAKRLAYNQRRGSKLFHQRVPMHAARPPGFQQRVPTQGSAGPGFQQRMPSTHGNARPGFQHGGPTHMGQAYNQRAQVHDGVPTPPKSNGSVPSRPNGGSKNSSIPKKHSTGAKVPPPPAQTVPPRQRIDTFWTICHRCKIHFEYFKMYLNKTLRCPNCKQPFVAKETSPPVICPKSQNSVSPRQKQPASADTVPIPNVHGTHEPSARVPVPSQAGSNSSKLPPNQQNPLCGTASARSKEPSIAVKAASVVQQARDKLKRFYTETNASAGSNGSVKCRKVDYMSSSKAQGHDGIGNTSGATAHGPNTSPDLGPIETQNVLSAKARDEVSDKLNNWNLENEAKSVCQEKDESTIEQCDLDKNNGLPDGSSDDQLERSQLKDAAGIECCKGSQVATMSVPDPDFYDFDQDRTERSFGDNEVWARYDDSDGMPRLYALINKVVSRAPFKLKVSWLNSKTNTEFSSLDWVGSGFYKTCGEFWVGKYKYCKDVNSFSHRINWSKGPRGNILILPNKGEVWALYRNWQPDWNKNTAEEVILKYDMVMVLEDYNEEKGVTVAPLEKVSGFKTVFCINSDAEVIKTIPKEEMFRFSHRVPDHVLTGKESPNAPKGCVELDPAATPLELLQVMTTDEANDDSTLHIDAANAH